MSKSAEEAHALLEKGDLSGAMKMVQLGLNRDPHDMAMLMVAGCIHFRQEEWGMAYNVLHRVREKGPPYPEILNNLGMSAANLASYAGKDNFLDEAEHYLRKAYRKSPAPEVISNLALVKMQKCDPREAERLCLEGLEKDSGNAALHETLGYACLYQGKWAEGFRSYEFNLGIKQRPVPGKPYWQEGMRGKKLFVQGEQGIGDEISYASVIPDAAKHNEIAYECDHRLEGLMRRSLPGVEVHGTRFTTDKRWRETRAFDAYCLSGSLCKEYRKKDEDFPRKGFLVADPDRRLQWRTLLDTLPGKKVGIAWTGGKDTTFKSRRSFNLEGLLPILKTPGITWVCLQYKDASKEIAELKEKHGIEIKHWKRATENCDYDETAALVSELDAVVSVTTAVVHLCGALGKKCYVLVPARCRWYYASDSSKHRWYDSLELFKQVDKWPVEKVAERLKADLL